MTHGDARRVRAVSLKEQKREEPWRRAGAMRCAAGRAGGRHGARDGTVEARHAHQDACTNHQQLSMLSERLSACHGYW